MTTSVSSVSLIQLLIVVIAAAASWDSLRGAAESPPGIISYQGRIMVGGVNFDGTGQFKFALINGTNGPTLWSNDGTEGAGVEPQLPVPLEVSRGIYGVLLGDTLLSASLARRGDLRPLGTRSPWRFHLLPSNALFNSFPSPLSQERPNRLTLFTKAGSCLPWWEFWGQCGRERRQ